MASHNKEAGLAITVIDSPYTTEAILRYCQASAQNLITTTPKRKLSFFGLLQTRGWMIKKVIRSKEGSKTREKEVEGGQRT